MVVKKIKAGDESSRQSKVCEIIRKEIAAIFTKGKYFNEYLFDKSITVSRIKITADLKLASIYVSPFGDYSEEKLLENLKIISPKIRHVLSTKINFKFSPELRFFIDDSFDYLDKINTLLSKKNL